jgi:hypothetical protein
LCYVKLAVLKIIFTSLDKIQSGIFANANGMECHGMHQTILKNSCCQFGVGVGVGHRKIFHDSRFLDLIWDSRFGINWDSKFLIQVKTKKRNFCSITWIPDCGFPWISRLFWI